MASMPKVLSVLSVQIPVKFALILKPAEFVNKATSSIREHLNAWKTVFLTLSNMTTFV